MPDMAEDENRFSADERAAMAQRAEELRSTKGLKGAAKLAKELEACIAAIDALSGTDGEVARAAPDRRRGSAPARPKTWYGFPPTPRRQGRVFVQPASKFDTRYGTLGFTDEARLDDGALWPTSFAVVEVTDAVIARIRDLVAAAVAGVSAARVWAA
jgi:hypothetical protein